MIRIVVEHSKFCPMVFCDACGERIADAKRGNYQWEMGDGGVPVPGAIVFTHKECCRRFEAEHGGSGRWGWAPLSSLPLFLARNLGLEPTVQPPPVQPDGKPMPDRDGGWWVTCEPMTVDCPDCGKSVKDRPAVMAYRANLDHGGQHELENPLWPATGWLLWRECSECGWRKDDSVVTAEVVKGWGSKYGGWRPLR